MILTSLLIVAPLHSFLSLGFWMHLDHEISVQHVIFVPFFINANIFFFLFSSMPGELPIKASLVVVNQKINSTDIYVISK